MFTHTAQPLDCKATLGAHSPDLAVFPLMNGNIEMCSIPRLPNGLHLSGTNLLSYANTPPRKGWKADVILACASKKEAEAVAEAWRKSYQNNGTYASMYES